MLAVNKYSSIESNNKLIKKFIELITRKLFKSWKLKSKKLSKSLKSKNKKLAKFKKLSKRKNLFNFDIKKIKPSFLIFNARMAFNCL